MVDGIPSSLVLPMDQGVVGDYSSKRRKKNKVSGVDGAHLVPY
jgi:hypothetical protein